MASIVNKLQQHQSSDGMNKSQPRLLKGRYCSQKDIKPISLSSESNIKTLTALLRRKSQQGSMSPSHRNKSKRKRPSSSLLNMKKTIEDYNTTHTSTGSRQQGSLYLNQQKSSGVLLYQTTLDNPYACPYAYNQDQTSTASFIDKSFCKTYERFTQQRIDAVSRLSSLKRAIEDEEKRELKSIPCINRKSKELCKSSGDFLTRMKQNEESVLKKKEKMIKVKKKKEFEEYLYYNKKPKANSSIDIDINDRIKQLFEWDSNRKKKLEALKENVIVNEQRYSIHNMYKRKCKHQQGLSNSIGKDNANVVINRLYKEDPLRIKAKKVLLMKALTPSFEPQINTSRNVKFKSSDDKLREIQLDYLSMHTENMLRERIINIKKKKKCSDL